MSERYAAFLRGINLGKRKATKEQLAAIFGGLGFTNVKTLIASGNVVFDVGGGDRDGGEAALIERIEAGLKDGLGFSVDTMLRTRAAVEAMLDADPFAGVEVTKQTRRYVTLLAKPTASTLTLPHNHMDGALRILSRTDREVYSVVTLRDGRGSVDLMGLLEKEYGKQVTTRNWNTIQKLRGL
ncbi:MAG: DUF1697 domain-containing protein [Chloroflexi bacterium]|nr:DUF1697 domain-containing protein [Chloroflexota bacterium]